MNIIRLFMMIDDPAGYGDCQSNSNTDDDGVLLRPAGNTKKADRVASEKIEAKHRVDDHRKNKAEPIMSNQLR